MMTPWLKSFLKQRSLLDDCFFSRRSSTFWSNFFQFPEFRWSPGAVLSRLSEELQGHPSQIYPSGQTPFKPLPGTWSGPDIDLTWIQSSISGQSRVQIRSEGGGGRVQRGPGRSLVHEIAWSKLRSRSWSQKKSDGAIRCLLSRGVGWEHIGTAQCTNYCHCLSGTS